MFSPETSYWVSQEQHRDRLEQIKRRQLVRLAEHQHPRRGWHQRSCRRLGRRLQQWGRQLEGYGTAPASNIASADM